MKRGFTLVELMIVIVILGIIAAIAIPKFSITRAQAEAAACRSNMHNLATAQNIFVHEYGYYATSLDDLEDVMEGVSTYRCPSESPWAYNQSIDPFCSVAYAIPGDTDTHYYIFGWSDTWYYILCPNYWNEHGYVVNNSFSWQ